jgi:hypoxanthine phosphoribosyltransferase
MDISTDDFFKAMACLHQQIRNNENTFDYIVGINRGGLIAGVVLSHRLQVPFRTVDWSLRDSKRKYIPSDLKNDVIHGKHILIVDDIVDGGETILTLKNHLISGTDIETNIKIACIVYNTAQKFVTPDYWFRQIDRNENKDWVNFWWEKNGHF